MSDFTGNGTLVRNGIIYGGGHDTEAVHWSEVKGYVGKNLSPNVTKNQTVNGITTTLNSDGSVTINGTATSWSQNDILKGLLKKDTYKISIVTPFPSGVFGTLRNDDTNTTIFNLGNGSDITEQEFTLSTDTNIRLYCGVNSGVTVSNLTIYPMIRLSSIVDSTYEPYIPDNRELTENKISISSLKTIVSASSDFSDFKTRIASL